MAHCLSYLQLKEHIYELVRQICRRLSGLTSRGPAAWLLACEQVLEVRFVRIRLKIKYFKHVETYSADLIV
eukprot:3520197-Pleurochrysis_carterae.AAC.1